MTLIQKFWARAFSTPDACAIVYDNGADLKQISWSQSGTAVALIMAFLRKKGVQKGDRVAILGWNSAEWVWADYAIQSLGAVTVPIYPNSSAEQAAYVLKDAGVKLSFAADDEQIKKVTVGEGYRFIDALTSLEDLVKLGGSIFEAVAKAAPSLARYPAVDAELSAMRAQRKPGTYFADLAPDDLATFIYTSGSSGAPKGCMITHGNIAAKMASMSQVGLGITEKDLVLSYLPLSHVLERVDGMGLCTWNGTPVAFSAIDQLAKNMGRFRPTVLAGVPAVWEKIYNGVKNPAEGIGKVLNTLFVWKPLFKLALASKPGTTAGKIFDRIVFDKVRAKLGGRLRMAVSGGAPINADVLHFFNRLGIEILEGYGATETVGGIVTNRPSWAPGKGPKNKVGSVGYVVPDCKVRIAHDPSEDEPGTGEIQLFGGQVFKGYWNLPEATANAFSEDGWYKTGDLGRMDDDGFVYVLGRKDGMYKTSGGKYVSREKLEGALKHFPIIHYSVPVAHGRKYPIALIFVNQDEAKKLAGAAPAGADAAKFYAEHDAVKAAVAEAIAGANKSLEHWEQVKRFKIMPLAATIDSGVITETLKIRSKVLIKRFAAEIDAVYAESK